MFSLFPIQETRDTKTAGVVQENAGRGHTCAHLKLDSVGRSTTSASTTVASAAPYQAPPDRPNVLLLVLLLLLLLLLPFRLTLLKPLLLVLVLVLVVAMAVVVLVLARAVEEAEPRVSEMPCATSAAAARTASTKHSAAHSRTLACVKVHN